jgi:hypothetical protein
MWRGRWYALRAASCSRHHGRGSRGRDHGERGVSNNVDYVWRRQVLEGMRFAAAAAGSGPRTARPQRLDFRPRTAFGEVPAPGWIRKAADGAGQGEDAAAPVLEQLDRPARGERTARRGNGRNATGAPSGCLARPHFFFPPWRPHCARLGISNFPPRRIEFTCLVRIPRPHAPASNPPRSCQLPHRIVQSASPTIGISCSPRSWQLRHRGDLEQGPASAPILLMT